MQGGRGKRPHHDRAIRLNPRYGDTTGAIADLDKAIKLNPKYAQTYGVRGITRLVQRKDAEAQQDFAKCFELDQGMRKAFELLIEKARAKHAGRP